MLRQRFGRLIVICLTTEREYHLLCRCDCGNVREVLKGNLIKGNTRSCGCLKRDLAGTYNRTHGQSDTPTYNVWLQMRARCTKPKNIGWDIYGGRGIRVCKRWLHSFENFLADMGPKPKGLTLDRIRSNLGYSPVNCRWATQTTQQRNRRNNHRVWYKRRHITIAELAEVTGIYESLLRWRLNSGRTVKEAISPTRLTRRR